MEVSSLKNLQKRKEKSIAAYHRIPILQERKWQNI